MNPELYSNIMIILGIVSLICILGMIFCVIMIEINERKTKKSLKKLDSNYARLQDINKHLLGLLDE